MSQGSFYEQLSVREDIEKQPATSASEVKGKIVKQKKGKSPRMSAYPQDRPR